MSDSEVPLAQQWCDAVADAIKEFDQEDEVGSSTLTNAAFTATLEIIKGSYLCEISLRIDPDSDANIEDGVENLDRTKYFTMSPDGDNTAIQLGKVEATVSDKNSSMVVAEVLCGNGRQWLMSYTDDAEGEKIELGPMLYVEAALR